MSDDSLFEDPAVNRARVSRIDAMTTMITIVSMILLFSAIPLNVLLWQWVFA